MDFLTRYQAEAPRVLMQYAKLFKEIADTKDGVSAPYYFVQEVGMLGHLRAQYIALIRLHSTRAGQIGRSDQAPD